MIIKCNIFDSDDKSANLLALHTASTNEAISNNNIDVINFDKY